MSGGKPIRVIDLFCGCGGLSLGFQNAGYEIVSAFDNWDEAISIYKKNFTHPIIKRDLSLTEDISDIESLHPDMIIGGPPCQDYSSAGHRDETLGRANLTISYAEIVTKVRPELFLMENVPTIQKSDKLRIVTEMFKAAGYGLSMKVMDASKCGVPQKRKRFILVGKLGEKDGFLDSILDSHLSEKSMTLRDYFGDSLGFEYYFRVADNRLPCYHLLSSLRFYYSRSNMTENHFHKKSHIEPIDDLGHILHRYSVRQDIRYNNKVWPSLLCAKTNWPFHLPQSCSPRPASRQTAHSH